MARLEQELAATPITVQVQRVDPATGQTVAGEEPNPVYESLAEKIAEKRAVLAERQAKLAAIESLTVGLTGELDRLHAAGGLTNALVQGRDPVELAQPGPVDGLAVLPSGPLPPNPAELLASERLRALWPKLLERFDAVLVDAPPVLAVTDAVLLAAQVDGVIMVVWAGNARVDIAREARNQLMKANARILGVVLNKVRMPGRDYHYYYYYRRDGEEDRVKL